MRPTGHIPKNQFSRPSVDLGQSAVKREWRTAPATEIEAGDTIPDFGIVQVMTHSEAVRPTPSQIVIVSTMGREVRVDFDEQCYFFGRAQ